MRMVVGGIVETLSPAKLWIGLKNYASILGDVGFVLDQIADDCDDFCVISATDTGVPWHLSHEKNKGKAETKRILEVRRWNSNIYPNVSLMSQFQQLRGAMRAPAT